MLIVPHGDRLIIEARVSPHDIDQVHIGQTTFVRFGAFVRRNTPEVDGEVIGISADLSRDETTREAYFTVRVAIPDSELAKLGSSRLQPGIPADVQIQTGQRTALSYLLTPIADQFNKAFRER